MSGINLRAETKVGEMRLIAQLVAKHDGKVLKKI